MKKIIRTISRFPSAVAILLISFYQRTLSPDHGLFKHRHPYGFCRFYPSCSQYAKEAIQKNGLIKGFFMGVWRVMRCNPWTEPKIDLMV